MPALSQGNPASGLAVLDTNVLLDWLVFRNPGVAPLVRALTLRQLTWISCPPMRQELARMLDSLSLARWKPDAAAALATHDALAQMRPPPRTPARHPRCTDPDDQIFVDLAIEHGAQWLLTQDRALLKLARRLRRAHIEVTCPAEWARRDALGSPAPAPATDAVRA